MSGILSEHPIIFIDKLLKLGIGDKGRLLYLRNYIKNGKPIYDSDKNFLKTLEHKLDEIKAQDFDKSFDTLTSDNVIKNSDLFSKFDDHKSDEKYYSDTTSSFEFDSEILQIQDSIDDLQKSNSKLKDNLELISLSRENLHQQQLEYTNPDEASLGIIKKYKSNSFSLFKNNSNSSNSKLFKLKKHDVMVYSSAGLFTLWYTSFQNVIDLGSLENIFLGLSAACAVSAGIFYMQKKSS